MNKEVDLVGWVTRGRGGGQAGIGQPSLVGLCSPVI